MIQVKFLLINLSLILCLSIYIYCLGVFSNLTELIEIMQKSRGYNNFAIMFNQYCHKIQNGVWGACVKIFD